MDGTVIIEPNANPEDRPNSLEINMQTGSVQAVFAAYNFLDHGSWVVYIPSFGLTSYGDDVNEAREMMIEEILPSYFNRLLALPRFSILEELGKLGWAATNYNSENFKNTVYVDKNGVLRNFDLPQDTPIEEHLVTV